MEERKVAKIDIISGFLGAGKTTLIKKLIEEAFKGEKLVLIENEFGEIGIDGGFLKDAGVQINEMNSGCICCSLVGDFGEALQQVVKDYAPDRIIIEPSGVGKLSDVIKAVQKAAEQVDIELNSATTVVDVTKAKMYIKNFGEFFLNQIEACGTVVLSRTQSAAEDKLVTAVDMIKEHNAEARIITTPWDDISGTVILDAIEHSSNIEDIMKNFKKHQNLILVFLLISCNIAILGMGLDERVISDNYNSQTSCISSQAFTTNDNITIIHVSESNLALTLIKGIRNSSRNKTFERNSILLIFILTILSGVFRLTQDIYYFYHRLYVKQRYYLISYIHAKDGRKRFMPC